MIATIAKPSADNAKIAAPIGLDDNAILNNQITAVDAATATFCTPNAIVIASVATVDAITNPLCATQAPPIIPTTIISSLLLSLTKRITSDAFSIANFISFLI